MGGRYGFDDSENGDFSIRLLKQLFVIKISILIVDWIGFGRRFSTLGGLYG